MVIWKRSDVWNGFGFFGESRHGKTPLSLAFARILVLRGDDVRILDDCFTIEGGQIRQCRSWGRRNHLGEHYYTLLSETLKNTRRSIASIDPGTVGYPLGRTVAYLLQLVTGIENFKKVRCHRQEFVDKLMVTNPFTWTNPKPGKEIILKRFNENWSYFLIQRQKEGTTELFDSLANQALVDSKLTE